MRELACVINVSEGRRIGPIAEAGGPGVVDVHSDPHHNRSVLTVAGPADDVWTATTAIARQAISLLDLTAHEGAHPRIGVVDVVPWVDLRDMWAPATAHSLRARDRFAAWAAEELGVASYLYGPERSLPEVRRDARDGVRPDVQTAKQSPTAGWMAVGARGVLVAYNLWLAEASLQQARRIAADIRRPGLRTLGLQVGDGVQVSCNLTEPREVGPSVAYDLVAASAVIERAELVGLIPLELLDVIPEDRWAQLDLTPERTIEARTGP